MAELSTSEKWWRKLLVWKFTAKVIIHMPWLNIIIVKDVRYIDEDAQYQGHNLNSNLKYYGKILKESNKQ